jgi:adenylate cyclase
MEGWRYPLAEIYHFNGFTLDLTRGVLLGPHQREIPLRPKSFMLLRTLVENAGRLLDRVSRMAAVWPGAVVTDENLAQCIKDVRRALGDEGQHLLKTVVKRGYILNVAVTIDRTMEARPQAGADADLSPAPLGTNGHTLAGAEENSGGFNPAPRLSIVVLPFNNLGASPDEDRLTAAISADLTTDLCRLDGASVVAYPPGGANRAAPIDAALMGKTLGVRYVVAGDLRKVDDVVRVNVQLVSAETNTYLWAGRFEHHLQNISCNHEDIVNRIRAELTVRMLAVERKRSLQERPDNPDATDFLLRARSLIRTHDQTELLRDASGLLEQALRLEPSSLSAMCDLASQLINRFMNYGDDCDNEDLLDQATALVNASAAIAPNDEGVIFRQGYLARALGRWAEAIAILQRLVEHFPHANHGFRQLGFCRLAVGQPDAAISLLERSISLDPLAPANRYAYRRISQAYLLLGQNTKAIDSAQRAVAENCLGPSFEIGECYVLMASAYALDGQLNAARHALAEANRCWPFRTVRTFFPPFSQRGLPHPVYVEQLSRAAAGLRMAGMRDHAEEGAPYNPVSDGALRVTRFGLTPSAIPGASTIRTCELINLLSHQAPLLIDAVACSSGRSLPGAVGLQGLSHGATLSVKLQDRFRHKIQELTAGDLSSPIVVYCANSERFTGYNLALRLVALGCTQVHWYRGGWEAWQVAGLPDVPLELQSW